MKLKKTLILLFLILSSFAVLPGLHVSAIAADEFARVENIRVADRSTVIQVTYDLIGNEKTYLIKLKMSANGGKTYTIVPKAVSGDVGARVKPGKDKVITWNVAEEMPWLYTSDFVFIVTVGDNEKDCPYGMALIPAGEFTMGCSPGDTLCDNDEKPARHVRITKPFCMDLTEVTQKAFKHVMHNSPSDNKECGGDCPVENVRWSDVYRYCEKIGKRIPTEAEWEYAVRGGTETKYYWGNIIKSNDVNYCDESSDCTRVKEPVGSFKPNPFGLYDMLGNVTEYVRDCYNEKQYTTMPENDPENRWYDLSGYICWKISVRGGSWNDTEKDVRVSSRKYVKNECSFARDDLGFRCASDL